MAEQRKPRKPQQIKKLTYQQEIFVDAYVRDGQSGKAALEAGFCASTGSSLLRNINVRRAINAARAKLRETRGILTAEDIGIKNSKFINFDPRKLYNDDGTPKGIHELDDDTALCLAGHDISETITESNDGSKTILSRRIKYAYPNRHTAVDSVARSLGMYVDRKDINISGTLDIEGLVRAAQKVLGGDD